MDEFTLKLEFAKHMTVREGEKITREMLFEMFREGVKYGVNLDTKPSTGFIPKTILRKAPKPNV